MNTTQTTKSSAKPAPKKKAAANKTESTAKKAAVTKKKAAPNKSESPAKNWSATKKTVAKKPVAKKAPVKGILAGATEVMIDLAQRTLAGAATGALQGAIIAGGEAAGLSSKAPAKKSTKQATPKSPKRKSA